MFRISLYIGLLLISLTVVSCGSSEIEQPGSGNNVIIGTWNNYHENTDSIVMIRVFTPNYYSYFTYAEGKEQNQLNKSRYYIDDTHIYLDKYTQSYKLNGDTLFITNSKGDQVTRYVRSSVLQPSESN